MYFMSNYETDLQQIKYMLQALTKQQEVLHEDVGIMKNELLQVKNTLIGNREYKIKGLVDEVEILKGYVAKDRLLKHKIWGGLTVIGVVWTFLFKYLTEWYKMK